MPMIKQYKNDAIRAKRAEAATLTRVQAEQQNDRLILWLERLPEDNRRDIGGALDRLTEVGMYAFDPVTVDCLKCGKEVYPVTEEICRCDCGADLSKEVAKIRRRVEPKPPETEDLPNIADFRFLFQGDEEVLQILAEIENLKIGCPEEWDVWNHFSNAQEALLRVR